MSSSKNKSTGLSEEIYDEEVIEVFGARAINL